MASSLQMPQKVDTVAAEASKNADREQRGQDPQPAPVATGCEHSAHWALAATLAACQQTPLAGASAAIPAADTTLTAEISTDNGLVVSETVAVDAGPQGDAAATLEVDATADSDAVSAPDMAADAAIDSAADSVADAAPDAAGADADSALVVDADAQAGSDTPSDAAIAPDTAVPPPQCQTSDDCPALGACFLAVCTPKGKCDAVVLAEGATCSDGNACSTGDLCAGASCVSSGALSCDDLNPCTLDKCNPLVGCVNLAIPATTACDDGDARTAADACANGACQSGVNTCQCQTNSECGKFDDGNLCNGTLYCDKSTLPYVCKANPATVFTCPTGSDGACQKNTCIPATGQCKLVLAPANTAACSDGNPCTISDMCANGTCKAGSPPGCDDKNPCTSDGCDPKTGLCLYIDSSAACNDSDACTDDGRNPKVGCVHSNNTGSCNDGNPCTAGELCVNAKCQGGASVVCSDKNPCTDPWLAATCPDSGQCQAKTASGCDDNNPCTFDNCDGVTGCAYPNVSGACDDGDKCTLGETCNGGKCSQGTSLVCTDGNLCTSDACEPKSGCVFAKYEDGLPCGGGKVCAGGGCGQ
ncbi:MAG: hypothetical protein EXR77_06725 [Myxococcales bacterium]|nr:hypothetical protein [Myxococcales bacterium]